MRRVEGRWLVVPEILARLAEGTKPDGDSDSLAWVISLLQLVDGKNCSLIKPLVWAVHPPAVDPPR